MTSKFLKLCSMLLVIVMVINMLPMQVFAAELNAGSVTGYDASLSTDQTVSAAPVQSDTTFVSTDTEPQEVVEKRTKYTKEFRLGNGLFVAAVYPDAVHYETANGWEEIDNTLKINAAGTYTNTAGVWNVSLPQQLTGTQNVTISKDGYTLSFRLSGELRSSGLVTASIQSGSAAEALTLSGMQTSAAVVQTKDLSAWKEAAAFAQMIPDKLQSRLVYADVFQGTDIVYDLDSNRVKESIILDSYRTTLRGYRYTLNVGRLIPVLEDDGQILFYDADRENIVMVMPAPYLVDANNRFNGDIQVQLTGSNGVYTLTYLLPQQWLAAEDRAWPVILDPVVDAEISTANIRDCTVAENTTYSSGWGINEAGYDVNYGIERFYLKYNELPTLTSSDVIVDASIQLYKPETSSTTAPIEVHKVNGTWDSSTITWQNMPGFNGMIEDYATVKNAGWYTWTITGIAQDWYANSNNGMMFKASDAVETGGVANWKQFCSADWGSNEPILSITFRNTNGLESYWDYTSTEAGRAGTGYVNNFTGNLIWVRNDMGFDGNRMPVSINHIYNASESQNNTFGLGYGWHTNFHQSISQRGDYYIWEDGDGTDHYFKADTSGVLRDEDGLYLTLTTTGSGNQKYCISDKYGNKSYFDTNGRLTKQLNNQQTASSITITYTSTTGQLINTITDGVGRCYRFVYGTGMLTSISYEGTAGGEIAYVNFEYSGSNLAQIVNEDGGTTRYTYVSNRLNTVTDVSGCKLTYTYSAAAPYRITKISESYNSTQGSYITLNYGCKQTIITDNNGNEQVQYFNDFGNTITAQDNQGRAQHTVYGKNSNGETGVINQVIASSKLQDTVSNLLSDHSFEQSSVLSWTTSTSGIGRVTTSPYSGSYCLKFPTTNEANIQSFYFYIAPGETYTFSAYVKVVSGTAFIQIGEGGYDTRIVSIKRNDAAPAGWKRESVSITNSDSTSMNANAAISVAAGSEVYVDCVQLEKTAAPSRYSLIENGDSVSETEGWSGSGLTTADGAVMFGSQADGAAPGLDLSAFKFTGSTTTAKRLSQTVKISGSANDRCVLTGWARGQSTALKTEDGKTRTFGMSAKVNYTNGTSETFVFSFSPNTDGTVWQYGALEIVPSRAYSSITVTLTYDYNVGVVYFDGIQLFREEFGESYTYDANGNVTASRDLLGLVTTYEYYTNGVDLKKVTYPTGGFATYTYDSYHNVKSITEDAVNASTPNRTSTYTYDTWGNQKTESVSNSGNSQKITASAIYTSNGNHLVSTTDAEGKTTRYSYDEDTSVLLWVQNPGDTTSTRTNYTYDSMFRVRTTSQRADASNNLTATYTYNSKGQLTKIQTGSSTYSFTYGVFGLRTKVAVDGRTLANYSYNAAKKELTRIDYGNGDSVQYTYDEQGRVTKETYGTNDFISYFYDSTGSLATIANRATGTVTTRLSDSAGRTITYLEDYSTGNDHRVDYAYDGSGNLIGMDEYFGTVDNRISTEYTYDADNRITSVKSGYAEKAYTYDAFGRVSGKVTKHNSTGLFTESYTFTGSGTTTSTQVASHTVGNKTYTYTYDNNGNILSISDGTNTTSYVYDGANQLIRENNQAGDFTHVWTYDNAGNIKTRKEYAYTTGTLGTPTDTVTYTYGGDEGWGDTLASYDGITIEYDEIGNPLTYGDWVLTWKHGRQLATLRKDNNTWTYSYNADGLRTERDCGVKTYNYVYNGSSLSRMTVDRDTLAFTYDAEGRPMTVSLNGIVYYYVTNLQGDVIGILNSSGTQVVTYTYDAWGKVLSVSGTLYRDIGTLNPLRYRGYVYDNETDLYYLQSRYYNPEWGRFINADGFVSTGQGILGNNMFAYCGNNPAINTDPTGTYFVREAGGGVSGFGGSVGGTGIITPYDTVWVNNSYSQIAGLVGTAMVVHGVSELRQEQIAINRLNRTKSKETTDSLAIDIYKTASNEAKYFGADMYGGEWRIVTIPLTYNQAKMWAIFTGIIGTVYGKGASWGLYTAEQKDAFMIASDLGGGMLPEKHFYTPGQYNHYHVNGFDFLGIYKHFHVWFGDING